MWVFAALTMLLIRICETPEFKLQSPLLEKATKSNSLLYFSFLDKLECNTLNFIPCNTMWKN